MPKRMLHFLGSLLVVGAVVGAPATAAADAPSTARHAGGGCNDQSPPSSRWGHGWYGHDNNGPYWRGWGDGDGYFGGRSYDPRCDAAHPGKVARVMVAVDRLHGSKCQRLSHSGLLGRAVACSRTRWIRAHGTRRWHHHIDHRLPAGHYRLHRRAVDGAGNHEREHVRHMWIR